MGIFIDLYIRDFLGNRSVFWCFLCPFTKTEIGLITRHRSLSLLASGFPHKLRVPGLPRVKGPGVPGAGSVPLRSAEPREPFPTRPLGRRCKGKGALWVSETLREERAGEVGECWGREGA